MVAIEDYASGGPWGLGWPGCCCAICPDAETDDFSRSDGTNINASWSEAQGDFSINDSTLQAPATSDSAAVWTVPPGGNKISFHMNSDLGPQTSGHIYRIIVNYVDANNYHFGEFKVGAGGHIRLCQMLSGSVIQLAILSTNVTAGDRGSVSLSVCFTPKIFFVGISGAAEQDLWITSGYTPFAAGYLAGLGSDGTEARFDDFTWNEHYDTNKDCPQCQCWCYDTPLPMEWTATLVLHSASDDCLYGCCNGASGTLTYDQGLGSWSGSILWGCAECSDASEEEQIDLTLQCEGTYGMGGPVPDNNFRLSAFCSADMFELDETLPAQPDPGPYTDEDELCSGNSCEPLELKFGHISGGWALLGPQCEPPCSGSQTWYKFILTPKV